MVERQLDVQPTITIRPGARARVLISRDLLIEPWSGKVRKSLPAGVSIPIPPRGTGAPLMRLNALPIAALPTRAIAARTREPSTGRPCAPSSRMQTDSRLIVTKGAEILCWGDRATIAKAFAGSATQIEGTDLPQDLAATDFLSIKGFARKRWPPRWLATDRCSRGVED